MTLGVKCARCGTALVVGASFCTRCGAAASIRCPVCGFTSPLTARFCSQCGAAVGAETAIPKAERLHLTVMICDLVGSTALSARLDPEDMREVIRAFQEACAAIISTYDGFLAKFMGDGMLAYFGYPRAHEDDAERAVRAGLDMIGAIRRLRTPADVSLNARVAIATGIVIAGDLIGEGSAQERAVVGDAPNAAARLETLAEPGTVVVADSTRRLLGDLFDLRDLGRHQVKGYAEPISAWVVTGEAQVGSRFEAVRARRLTGFVGREPEIELLVARQQRAWRGDSQVVLISGEAGIGKSRLAAWLADRPAAEPHTVLRYQCSPYHSGTALHPFLSQLARAAGFLPQDTPEQRLDKLEGLIAQGAANVQERAPLFAALLSIPAEMRYPPLGLSAAQQRHQTFAALLDQLEGLARKQPLLVLFEDLQWADATSLELIGLAIERFHRLPVLAIVTFRKEFEPSWSGMPQVTTLALGPLDPAEARAMIAQLTGGKPLPGELTEQIVAKTDGVPLFIEELTKTVLEGGLLVEEADRYRLDGPLPLLAIPATLRETLSARLDRLAPVKEVAQIGAVIGREFSYGLLRSAVSGGEADLQAALAQLGQAELLFARSGASEIVYTFKHALVQETAYESLLKSRRQLLHRRIGEALRDRFPNVAEKEPEVVAHHFTQAGFAEAAIEWWKRAGERALRRSAYVEAISHLSKALGIAEKLADSPQTRMLCLQLQVLYGQAQTAIRGTGAPETTAAFVRARELAAQIEQPAERFSAYLGLFAGSFIRGELAPMREMATAFLRETENLPGTLEAAIAHRIYGTTCGFEGDWVTAKTHLERALAIYDRDRHAPLAYRFGHDTGVAAECYLAITLWALGEVERARAVAESAMAHAVQSEHIDTLAYCQAYMCVFEAIRRDPARTARYAEALVAIARGHGMEWWLVTGTFFRGWTRWHAGEREAGVADMRQGMALCRSYGLRCAPALFEALLAETEAEAGEVGLALARLDELLGEIERTGVHSVEAEVLRQRGELLLRREPVDSAAAEDALLRALAVARTQRAKTFELRASLGLARLYQASGRHEAARAVLVPMRGVFSKGPELPEVDELDRLLASLG